MVLFLTVALYVSIAGMIVLVVLKRLELRTGHIFFAGVRPHVTRHFRQGFEFFVQTLPSHTHRSGSQLLHTARALSKHAVASTLLWLEHRLERLLKVLRHTTVAPEGTLPPSPFLREVAEHKKTLLRRKVHRIEGE